MLTPRVTTPMIKKSRLNLMQLRRRIAPRRGYDVGIAAFPTCWPSFRLPGGRKHDGPLRPGATSGNRTRTACLEGRSSAIELRRQTPPDIAASGRAVKERSVHETLSLQSHCTSSFAENSPLKGNPKIISQVSSLSFRLGSQYLRGNNPLWLRAHPSLEQPRHAHTAL